MVDSLARLAGKIAPVPLALVIAWLLSRRPWSRKQDPAPGGARPWEHRADWSSGRADSMLHSPVLLWSVVVAFGIVSFSFPMPAPWRASPGSLILFLLLPALAALFLAKAVRATVRRQRFGSAYFQFDSLPFSPGKKLSGRIHVSYDHAFLKGIRLRLECVRLDDAGDSSREKSLWSGDQFVPPQQIVPSPTGQSIPVNFWLPQDAPETVNRADRFILGSLAVEARSGNSEDVVWRLVVNPGTSFRIIYRDRFQVPVFRTGHIPESAIPPGEEPRMQETRKRQIA